MQVVRAVVAVEGARHNSEYRLEGVYSHPSKNEGWGTLCPGWVGQVKGWAILPTTYSPTHLRVQYNQAADFMNDEFQNP